MRLQKRPKRQNMTDSADISTIQLAARAFYAWFHGQQPEPAGVLAIRSFLGTPIAMDELSRLGERLQQNQAFLEAQRPVVEKWQSRMTSSTGISDEDAAALIEELFTGFDHALLYERDIRASSTLVHRGQVNSVQARVEEMPCWTLHLNLAGGGIFLSEKMERRTAPGDMMLMRPDARYHYGLHPLEEDWQHLWALFQPRPHWAELTAWKELDQGISLLVLPEGEARSRVERLFRELIDIGHSGGVEQSDLQHNKLEEILIRARAVLGEQESKALDTRIRHACEYMRSRLEKKFTLEEVAAECNLSLSRFAHLFAEQMGLSPKAWINDIRLQAARKLLLTTDKKISRIGSLVGYEDPAHFTRYFSKNMGCSPRHFRQSFSKDA